LDLARANLGRALGARAASDAVRLENCDMLGFALSEARAAPRSYDLVFASFAIHHLPEAQKQQLLRLIGARLLAPGGAFILVDIFLDDGRRRTRRLHCWEPLPAGCLARCWRGAERSMPPIKANGAHNAQGCAPSPVANTLQQAHAITGWSCTPATNTSTSARNNRAPQRIARNRRPGHARGLPVPLPGRRGRLRGAHRRGEGPGDASRCGVRLPV
jgi:SAM-dependent methyltransferase